MRRPLALFVVSSLLPIVLLCALFGAASLRDKQAALERQARMRARFAATLVARELSADLRSAEIIAQSPGLDRALDTPRLTTLMLRLKAQEPLWRALSISDPQGRRLLDAPTPVGDAARGLVVETASFRRAVEGRRSVIGAIAMGPRGRMAFPVRAPVVRDGRVVYVVSVIVDPAELSALLLPETLAPGWSVEVLDGSGRVAAREPGPTARIGRLAGPAALAWRPEMGDRLYDGRGVNGEEEVGVSAPIPGGDWTVHVAMPADAYGAPVRQAAGALIAGLAGGIILTGILTWLLLRELRQERRREAAAQESQRLEALGRMTGGVAHDFNNLLTPIMGGMDLLQRRLQHDAAALRLIEAAQLSAQRAKTLVSRLLAFARRQALEPQDVDVGALLLGLEDLLQGAVGADITLNVEIADRLPAAHVDPAQLELAILNLAVNARDAMPEGGLVTIEAVEARVREPRTGLKPGRYVRISVEDTGVGMDAATLKRAVEPFFTTKGAGAGTGLGLSMVHGLAAQSGGALTLDSEPGRGVRAEVWLPARSVKTESSPAQDRTLDERTCVILLVDDDDLALASTAALLRDHGHDVLEARSGADALSMLATARADVLVTDYAMPGMSGAELIQRARRMRPGLPALIITGFVSAAEDVPADVARLAKPFRRIELLNHVAILLPEDRGGDAEATA